MRLGFVRCFTCLLLTCCVPVLVGIAERKRRPRRPSNSNEECDAVETSVRRTRSRTRTGNLSLVTYRDPKEQNQHNISQNFTLKNVCCSKASLSCKRRSCSVQLNSTAAEFTCHCDSYCEFFLDCCYDYWNACNSIGRNEENFTKLKEDLFLSWSCITVGRSSYWMKNNCSKSWPNNEIASLCIHPPSCLNSSTYMDFLPVLGADNGTYRNRHCAQCNYQNKFEFWMLNVSLSFQPIGIRSIEDLIDYVVELMGNNIYNTVVPKEKMPRRYCRRPISSCPFNLTFANVNECSLDRVALVFADTKLYKNKHCAFCNGNNNPVCEPPKKRSKSVPGSDFYLTVNFKHKSQSHGYSFNHACPKKMYDHHLKACVDPKDLVPPIDTPLDKYRIAIWFLWPHSTCNMPNITHFQNYFTDVEPSDISSDKFLKVQLGIYMIRFDVKLTLNQMQRIELLGNYSRVEPNSTVAYSTLKFVKPFTRPFTIRLGSKTVKVIKTSSRRLGCVGLQVYSTSDYTKVGPDGKIYVHKTNRNYTRDQYFKDNSLNGLIRVCEKQLPNDCGGFFLEYSRSEFEIRTNLSLYHKLQGVQYRFGEYTVRDNTVYICHNALGHDNNVIRHYLTLIGLFLSIFCLIIVLVTYIIFSRLRTAPGKNIINLTIALVLLGVMWLVSPEAVQIRPACIAMAYGTQYFTLVAHISMAKIAHDTLCMFTDPIAHQRSGSTQLKIFMLFWVFPLLFVTLTFILWHFNILDVHCTKNCWFSGQHVFAIVYIPVCLTIAFNIFCFTRSIMKMRKLEQNGQMLRAQKREKSSVLIYVKISTILGLGWSSTFIAVLFPVFSYVFVFLSTFQGVYIFVAFVCNRNVLTLYRNLVCGKKEASVPMHGQLNQCTSGVLRMDTRM